MPESTSTTSTTNPPGSYYQGKTLIIPAPKNLSRATIERRLKAAQAKKKKTAPVKEYKPPVKPKRNKRKKHENPLARFLEDLF